MSLDLPTPSVRAVIPRPGGFGHMPAPSKYAALVRLGCSHTGADFRQAMKGSLTRAAVVARRWAWARLKSEGASYSGIGKCSGYDHATIMYGLRKMDSVELYIELCRLQAVTTIGRFIRSLA